MKPDSNFGVISEQLESLVENYQEQEKEINEKVKKKNRKHLKEVIYYKALKALSAPGDGVGVLAAQVIINCVFRLYCKVNSSFIFLVYR